jgi:hypothetical protein
MERVITLLGQFRDQSAVSAAVTVIAMLIAGVLAKLDGARWGLYVIAALCLFHIAMAIHRRTTRPDPEPGQ